MANQSLFEISTDLYSIDEMIASSGGQLTEEVVELLNMLEGKFDDKLVKTTNLTKHYDYQVENIDAEIKRLQVLKRQKLQAIARVKEYIINSLDNLGLKKRDLGTVKITVRDNAPRVEIVDEIHVPDKYYKEKVTKSIDKMMIKDEYAKTGILPQGVTVERGRSLTIK